MSFRLQRRVPDISTPRLPDLPKLSGTSSPIRAPHAKQHAASNAKNSIIAMPNAMRPDVSNVAAQ